MTETPLLTGRHSECHPGRTSRRITTTSPSKQPLLNDRAYHTATYESYRTPVDDIGGGRESQSLEDIVNKNHKYPLTFPFFLLRMTTRNLNGNWIDTLRRQYVYDLKDESPHPIKYLLYNPHKKQDLYFVITNKIEEPQLRRSLVKYHLSTKGTSVVEWENEHIQVIYHPRYAKELREAAQSTSEAETQNESPTPEQQT